MKYVIGILCLCLMGFYSVIDHMPGFLIFGPLGVLILIGDFSGAGNGYDDEPETTGYRSPGIRSAARIAADARFQEMIDEYDERQAAKSK